MPIRRSRVRGMLVRRTGDNPLEPEQYETEAGRAIATTVNTLGEQIDALVAELEADDLTEVTAIRRDASALALEAPTAVAIMCHWLLEAHFEASDEVAGALAELRLYLDNEGANAHGLMARTTRILSLQAENAAGKVDAATGTPNREVH